MGVRGLTALRAKAVVRGSRIQQRRIVVPADDIRELTTIEQRNDVYKRHAPALAAEACEQVIAGAPSEITAVVSSSCTGYMLPSLALRCRTPRFAGAGNRGRIVLAVVPPVRR
jgi:predicted naringenin-chalcone synthase